MRSIESRIITLFIVFVLAIEIIGFIPFQRAQKSEAQAALEAKLVNGEQTIRRLLDQQTTLLTDRVTKVVNDRRLAQFLVNSNAERRQIDSLLVAQAVHLNASLAWLLDRNGEVQAASHQLSAQLKKISAALVLNSDQQDYCHTLVIHNHLPLQLIAVLLRTPTTQGWVVMAFPLSEKWVAEIEEAITLPITVLVKGKQHWQVASSSLAKPEAALLAKYIPETITAGIAQIVLNNTEYSIQVLELAKQSSEEAVIVLQGSINDMLEPYNKVQVGFILLTLISLAIALFGHITFTRRISQPLRQLSEIAKRLGSGDYRSPIQVSGDPAIRDLAHAFLSMRDGIAHREEEIKRLAYWDTLTDLPNRAQFTLLLKQAIASKQTCYVLMMDLDRFKHVNDILGHNYGDVLLKKVADRLREALPDVQLARLGGDEFAILLPNSNLVAAQEAAMVLLLQLEKPIILEDQVVDLGAGVGLAGYPEHGEDAESLVGRAEAAMYAAKQRVGNNFVVYSPEIDQSSQQNLSLLGELRSALREDQLRLYVQPKFNLKKQEVVGVEALVRWVHPTRGFLTPDQFIPFAEQTGIIRLLTRWILDKAAALCATLTAQGINLKVSVNISTYDLLDQDLPVKFAYILTHHRVKTSSFCLEITESAIMNDPHRAQLTLERLNAMGVELSIDDFGTGYSSLAYLKRLPVRELKIDKSFVMHMEHDADDRKIVKSTIDLGHNMGLRVVAEGVEATGVVTLLTRMGCDQVQGNYIHPALPAEQLVDWLEQRETLLFS